jgi:hypothetical protein
VFEGGAGGSEGGSSRDVSGGGGEGGLIRDIRSAGR